MRYHIQSAIAAAIFGISTSLASADDGFRDLFNGTDLTGWQGGNYYVEDGVMICRDGTIMTTEFFANYVLEFEFRLPPGGNNGLGIHYPGHGNAAYTGMELQILDDTHPQYAELKDYQYHGSLYELAAAKRATFKPVGEWNHQRVQVNGPRVVVEVNGEITLDVNLDEINVSHPDHQGAKRRSGHIALLGHGDPVAFRNIRVREIPPSANVSNVRAQGYESLFDGESLAGWKHPEGIENWYVHSGILKHTGKPGEINDLWTEREFGDFTMVLDWRWAQRGEIHHRPHIRPDGSEHGGEEVEELDSGVYVRGSTKSQVNIWNWPVGSGEVYGYRTDGSMPAEVRAGVTPSEKADRPLGEWNRMMITMKGDKLTVVLNGRQVIDNAELPGVPAKGPIGLQHHGQAIDFANIWIKEH